MKITKKEAIKNHRKMWNWIANRLELGEYVDKKDYFKRHGIITRPSCLCYACEYSDQFRDKMPCEKCPIDWGKTEDGKSRSCTNNHSLYLQYIVEGDLKKRAKLARQIARLPVLVFKKREED